MSNYSMSPPQKPAPRPFSPAAYSNAGSPTNSQGYAQPPAKRQRLSPDARSPTATPQYGAPSHPLPSMYGNPYAPQASVQSPYGSPSTFAGSPQSSFNTPQYHPNWQSQPPTPAPAPSRQMSPTNAPAQSSTQMMPPPPRPNKDEKEERTNIDDIGDPMYASGVNLKDEEAYMHSQFNNQHTTMGNSFSSNQSGAGTSFGSSTMSPNNSFNLLTQGTSFADGNSQQHGGAFAGTLGQTQSQEQIEEEMKRKRDQAVRDRNDRWQHHMHNQFLLTNAVRNKIDVITRNQGVVANLNGLYQRQDLQPRTNVMVNGAGTDGIAAIDTRPEFTAAKGEPFEQLLSLISLAGGERLRGLMDEAFALSRARRYGDHGRVPPEFADIAVNGQGERRPEDVVPESITGTQWDKVPDSEDAEMTNGIDGDKSTTPQPQPTISFTSAVALKLREVAKRDRLAEDARLRKREARRKAAAERSADAPANDSAAEGSAPENASAPADAAPKVSKKEQARLEKAAKNEREGYSHNTTNQTAAMMALGKKGSKYSWMTGGAAGAAGLQNRYKAPATTSGSATPAAAVKSEAASPGGAGMARGSSEQGIKVAEWGDWREDGGVQARDWMAVLERDGRQAKALQRLSLRLQ